MRTSRSRSSPPSCSRPGSSSSSAPGRATRTARSPRPSPALGLAHALLRRRHVGGRRPHRPVRPRPCSRSSGGITTPSTRASRPCSRCPSMTLSARFEDGSVDLLHIDGYHTYEAVSARLRGLAPQARHPGRRPAPRHRASAARDFGVWRLSAELTSTLPRLLVLSRPRPRCGRCRLGGRRAIRRLPGRSRGGSRCLEPVRDAGRPLTSPGPGSSAVSRPSWPPSGRAGRPGARALREPARAGRRSSRPRAGAPCACSPRSGARRRCTSPFPGA